MSTTSPTQGPLPVTLVTGFLGSGKTTLLRQLVKAPHGLSIGLILNEFGQAGIDQAPGAEEAYLELAEGCACCLKNPELVSAMHEMSDRGDIDRVLLETSGIANPLPLIWTLQRPDLADRVRLDAVITVVDPLNVEKSRGEEWDEQVRSADVVVLSKRDIASPEQIADAERVVREVNPDARFVEPGPSLPVEVLLDLEPGTLRPPERTLEQRHSTFGGFTLSGPQRWELDALEDLLESLPEEVFRVKGIVPTTDDSWVSFHVVGGRLQIDTQVEAPSHAEGRVAVFGRALDGSDVREAFERCRE